MTRYLSLPPELDDATVLGLESTLRQPADGELVILAGQTTSLPAYGLAYLRAGVDAERLRGDRVTLERPLDAAAMRRIGASGFLADLGIDLEPALDRLHGTKWRGVPMQRLQEPGDVVAFSTAAWQATQPYGSRLAATVLQAAEALTSNSLEFSDDPLGPIGLLELGRGRLELVVVDRGIGLRAALERQGRNVATDIDALLAALGMTSRPAETAGLPVLGHLIGARPAFTLTLRSGHGGIRVGDGAHRFEEFGITIGGVAAVLRRSAQRVK